MKKKFLALAIVLAGFTASAGTLDYAHFLCGKGGRILRYIAKHDTEEVTDAQARELFDISLNLEGGIVSVRNALMDSFPGSYEEDWQISENQLARLRELWDKLNTLSSERDRR